MACLVGLASVDGDRVFGSYMRYLDDAKHGEGGRLLSIAEFFGLGVGGDGCLAGVVYGGGSAVHCSEHGEARDASVGVGCRCGACEKLDVSGIVGDGAPVVGGRADVGNGSVCWGGGAVDATHFGVAPALGARGVACSVGVQLEGVSVDVDGVRAGDIGASSVGDVSSLGLKVVGGSVVVPVRQQTPGAFGKPVSPNQVRGPNWERNRLAKEEKKKKKKRQRERKEKLNSETWRSGGSVVEVKTSGFRPSGGEGGRRGYFDDLEGSVVQELKQSRAKMMIAENKRKAKEAEEKLKHLESPLALLATAMRAVRVAEQCAKKQGDQRVAGWARTVAESYAESVAKSAPSSVPSLDSVKSTVSVSSADIKAARQAEYAKKKKDILESYEEMEVFSPAVLKAMMENLDDEYEDVNLTIEEQVKKTLINPLSTAMSRVCGIGPEKIQQIFHFAGMATSGELVYC